MQAVANGIDTDRFCHTQDLREKLRVSEDLKPKDKVVLSVGSLTEVKDYPNLLKAFAEVCQSTNKAVQLWIAGEGCLLFELQELAAQLSVAGRVRFLGVRHDIPDLMNVADVFVLPSALEGFGIVVAEAMACQKVVVATNCGGVGEVLGDCGFLVPPQDSHALAEAMAQALALTAEDATSMGVRARQRVVDKYSLDRVVEIWVDLYREKELYK